MWNAIDDYEMIAGIPSRSIAADYRRWRRGKSGCDGARKKGALRQARSD
jgi:hypothetical protein